MFEFKDLKECNVEIELSETIKEQQNTSKDPQNQFLEKMNLKTLKLSESSIFKNLRIAFKKFEDIFPSIIFDFHSDYIISLKIYTNGNISLNIQKNPKEFEDEKLKSAKTKDPFTLDLFKKIETDFNFLYGNLCGILQIEDPHSIEIKIELAKEKTMPIGKTQILTKNLSTIINNPKVDINGLEFNLIDEQDKKKTINILRTEKEFAVKETFKLHHCGIIDLSKILEKSITSINDITKRIYG